MARLALLFINGRRLRCWCAVVLIFCVNSVFAATSKQGTATLIKIKPVTIIMLAVTESASDAFDGISKRAVIHRELSRWQKNKTFSKNVSVHVFAQAGQNKCTVPNLVSGNNNLALKVIQQSHPVGQLSSLQMIKTVIKKYSTQKVPVNIVLIGLGKNICDVDMCQQTASLNFGNIKTYVLGMALDGRDKKAMQCLTQKSGGVFLNAKNTANLNVAMQDIFQRLVLKTKYKPALVTLKTPGTVKTGKTFKVIWSGSGNNFDRIVLRSADDKVSHSYVYPLMVPGNQKRKRTASKQDSAKTVIMTAPAKAGNYRVSYVSVRNNTEIASRPLKVVKTVARLNTVLSAPAGSKIRIEWSGPADQYDQIRIVAKSDPDKPLAYNYVSMSKNGVLFLDLPPTPGVYEIHYLGKNDRVLANNRVVALPASVTLESPETVVAGVPFHLSWRAPMNQYDRIRILSVENPDKSLAYIYAGSYPNSMATMTAPRKSGSYVLQYIASDKTILAHRVFRVIAAKISLEMNTEVMAGRNIRVKWRGDVTQYDQVQIVNVTKKGSAMTKAYSHVYAGYNRTGIAKLEAPEKAGLYEVIYITRDKVILARHAIAVVSAKASIKALAPVKPGAKFKVAWQGPANRYDRIRIMRVDKKGPSTSSVSRVVNSRQPKAIAYVYVNMYANRAISFTAPRVSGEYEVQYLTRQNKCLAKTRLLVKNPNR